MRKKNKWTNQRELKKRNRPLEGEIVEPHEVLKKSQPRRPRMKGAQKTKADWIAIEGQYRAGTASVRAIAAEHRISEATIRKTAKQYGWLRDPQGAKRELVKAQISTLGALGTINKDECHRALEVEANADVEDMKRGIQVFRNLLAAMLEASQSVASVLDAKNIAEATTKAIDGIRKIRGLDDVVPTISTISYEESNAIIQAVFNVKAS